MKDEVEMMKKQFSLKADLVIGIGDLSKLTGVSTRQLRYWEKRGYLEAPVTEKNVTRKYEFEAFYKVRAIKKYLDEGFTLPKAAEQADKQKKQVVICKKFVNEMFIDVSIEDGEKLFGRIDMGYVDVEKIQHLYGIVDETGSHFEIVKE
ncbi:MAG: MerR family transcriptional regulator [Liquorilactobacillus hordei]|uniref:MerR family transcriptional regulator n=2 Tax=Liquorilactobacillus hordei TaxID=468911 RepID=A0A0R1MNI3_9LACO|nr:MerR family transcriptional regulator [Liquorilactobacillus hordei DSM 19519]